MEKYMKNESTQSFTEAAGIAKLKLGKLTQTVVTWFITGTMLSSAGVVPVVVAAAAAVESWRERMITQIDHRFGSTLAARQAQRWSKLFGMEWENEIHFLAMFPTDSKSSDWSQVKSKQWPLQSVVVVVASQIIRSIHHHRRRLLLLRRLSHTHTLRQVAQISPRRDEPAVAFGTNERLNELTCFVSLSD